MIGGFAGQNLQISKSRTPGVKGSFQICTYIEMHICMYVHGTRTAILKKYK